ncbi:structural maintenance of chromosomes protein 6 [Hyalella azteca]|uniref:Structural maintenance of chromosomes protein 6 n=1 Tax=Hyalella azteca TaxID=294128 RepID=A0A8B7NRL2_HYAAZ|nr:structural maintenance of chromosomes protein 6 [Hyalella azteca]
MDRRRTAVLKRRNNLKETVNGHESPTKRAKVDDDSAAESVAEGSLLTQEVSLLSSQSLPDCGRIEKISLRNFMCHSNLEFNLTPHINLIQGRNGSGKSAVLTAVVVGLGGTSRATNRAANLKGLIQYGRQMATIEVTLSNEGANSYKFSEFGPSIKIERRISSNGTTQYRIKDHRGNVKSTKKEHLMRIRDVFNLQVENPIVILNQDKAKEFLPKETPKTMYKLFMEATQMQCVRDDYDLLKNNVATSKQIVEDRRKNLPKLEREMLEWKKKKEFLVSLEEKRNEEKRLRSELCWTLVAEAEQDAETQKSKHTNIKKTKQKITDGLAEIAKEIRAGRKENNDLQKDIEVVGDELKTEEEARKKESDSYVLQRRLYNDHQSKKKMLKDQINKLKEEERLLKKALSKDHNADHRAWEAKNSARLAEIAAVEAQMKQCEEASAAADEECNEHNKLIMDLREQLQDLKCEEKGYEQQTRSLKDNIKNAQNKKVSKYTVFGAWVPGALADIEKANKLGKFEKKPIGPLGAFIEVRDPAWAHIAEKALGNYCNSFRCHSWQDCNLLKTILAKHVDRIPNISCGRFSDKVHDVAPHETYSPEHGYRSLWSILKFSHPVVANAVIDSCSVESTLLVPTAEEAGAILKNRYTVPRNCRVAYTLNGDKYLPDPNFKVYGGQGKNPARYLQVSVQDHILDLENGLRSCQQELEKMREEMRGKQREMNTLESEQRRIQDNLNNWRKRMVGLRSTLTRLQNDVTDEPLPPDLNHLQEELASVLERQQQLEQEYKSAETEAAAQQKLMAAAQAAAKEAMCKVNACKDRISNIKNEMLTGMEEVNQLLKKEEALKQKLHKTENDLREQQKLVEIALGKVEETIAAAEKIEPVRVPVKRSSKEVDKKLVSLSARLSEENKKIGSVEEVTTMYKEKYKLHHKAKTEIAKQSNFLTKLQEGYEKREANFVDICKYHSIYLQHHFARSLRNRNIDGVLDVDHDKKLLTINTCKSSSSKVTPTKGKKSNLAMMSGGERSFITVSFMLALWETVFSPIRMLDEFDVFMDIVSRNQSMDMMIQASRPQTQYLYLTPLDVKKRYDKKIAIFRMPDPDRNAPPPEE